MFRLAHGKATALAQGKHLLESFRRPIREPVDGAAIGQGWQLAQSLPESLSHRAHAQHNVQLRPDTLNEGLPEEVRAVRDALQGEAAPGIL